jgi:putative endonuclease
MPHLYILESVPTGRLYVGSTSDLSRRLTEHQRGQTPSTRNRGPWKLVYQEEYRTLSEARRRERQLKSWKSRRSLIQLIHARNSG